MGTIGDSAGVIPVVSEYDKLIEEIIELELFGIVKGGDIAENLDENDSWIEIYIDVYMRD